MKRLILIGLSLITLLLVHAQDEFETATQAVKNMRVGWNLGNTLDSHKNGVSGVTETETLRGQPVTQPELMEMMKMAGFNAIRVPVTWYPHMDSEGNIDQAWMDRVQQVVDYVIDQDMYCIINVHHDTGKRDTSGETSKGWLQADRDNYAQNKDLFEKIWRQIATRFRDYNQLLLFEGYNEMLDIYSSWNWASYNYGNRSPNYDAEAAQSAYDAINGYASSFVNTVRATGGNNAMRNLIVNTYGACDGRVWNNNDPYPQHIASPLSSLNKPEQSDHIAFEVHTYPPIVETDNGEVTGLRSTEKIQAQINSMIANLKQYFIDRYDAPVIIGEWGTSLVDASPNDYEARREHMFEFVDYLVEQAKQNDIATFYWMGLSNKSSRSKPVFDQPDLAERILKAYYGQDYEPMLITNDDYSDYDKVTFEQQYSELIIAESDNDLTTKYKGIEVQLAEAPNYSGNLSFRTYTAKNGTQHKNHSNLTSTTNTLLFSDAAQTPIKQVSIVWRTAGTASINLVKVYLIRLDGSKVEPEKPYSKNKCTFSKEALYAKVKVGTPNYSTLYYSNKNLVVPPRTTATAYRVQNDVLVGVHTYESGEVIPANTGVVVSTSDSGIYKFSMTQTDGVAATGNMLLGTDDAAPTTGGSKYYKLSFDQSAGDNAVGFYPNTSYAGPFVNGAHQAYLALPADAALPRYLLSDALLDGIPINTSTFPDDNMRTYMTAELSLSTDQSVKPGTDLWLSVDELVNITELNCSNQSIQSLQGIEYLRALKKLNCNGNQVKTLAPTQNKALRTINCSSNALETLDVSQNTLLEQMWCSSNKLTELDVSNNPALFELWAVNMPTLATLDVSQNPALKYLYCRDNALTELDVSNNRNLEILQCYSNSIETLNLTNNLKLRELVCRNNGMKLLLLPATNTMTSVKCQANQLTELDVSPVTGLTELICNDNRLTALDLSAASKLKTLDYSNQVRDGLTAESFEIKVDDESNDTKRYYYLRLDNLGTENEISLVDRMTQGNYECTPSSFQLAMVTGWNGAMPVSGTKQSPRAPAIDTPDPSVVIGNILALDPANDNGQQVSGTVTYTYNVQLPSEATVADPASPFTLNWTADASVVTGLTTLPAGRHVQQVTYTDALGRTARRPFNGVNIVVTRYSDGTVTTSKLLK